MGDGDQVRRGEFFTDDDSKEQVGQKGGVKKTVSVLRLPSVRGRGDPGGQWLVLARSKWVEWSGEQSNSPLKISTV